MLDVMTNYFDLMLALDELPVQVANHQKELNELELALSLTKRQFDDKRNDLISVNGGWSAQGKNESERELNVKALIQQDSATSALQTSIYTLEQDIIRINWLVNDCERRYGAVCYKIRLHSALLMYLANASAQAPIEQLEWKPMLV